MATTPRKRRAPQDIGVCRRCGVGPQKLSRAHWPPSGAYNLINAQRYTRALVVADLQVSEERGEIKQGGVWFYTLCSPCNSYYGRYDSEYIRLARTVNDRLLLLSAQGGPTSYDSVEIDLHIDTRAVIISVLGGVLASADANQFGGLSALLSVAREPEKFRDLGAARIGVAWCWGINNMPPFAIQDIREEALGEVRFVTGATPLAWAIWPDGKSAAHTFTDVTHWFKLRTPPHRNMVRVSAPLVPLTLAAIKSGSTVTHPSAPHRKSLVPSWM
jgi:hypothetical protein